MKMLYVFSQLAYNNIDFPELGLTKLAHKKIERTRLRPSPLFDFHAFSVNLFTNNFFLTVSFT